MEHLWTVLTCYRKRHLTDSLATGWLNTTNVEVRKLSSHFNVGGMHTAFPKTQIRTLIVHLRHSIIALTKFVKGHHIHLGVVYLYT